MNDLYAIFVIKNDSTKRLNPIKEGANIESSLQIVVCHYRQFNQLRRAKGYPSKVLNASLMQNEVESDSKKDPFNIADIPWEKNT